MGLGPLALIYLLVTIVRSIRADFAPEIWKDLGRPAEPQTFSQSEFWVAMGVMVVNGSVILIRDNRRAFFVSLATCGLGFGLLSVALIARQYQVLDAFQFMVLVGLGLYLPYVAFHTTVFERMLAMTREQGNVAFLMYVVDSVGYLGYVAVMVAHNFGPAANHLLLLLTTFCWVAIMLSAACLLLSWQYFHAVCPEPAVVEGVEPVQGVT